jgi:hypothetical protein
MVSKKKKQEKNLREEKAMYILYIGVTVRGGAIFPSSSPCRRDRHAILL